MKSKRRGGAAFDKWRRDTRVAIENVFGESSGHVSEFNQIQYAIGAGTTRTPEAQFQQEYVRGLERAESMLASMIDEVREYWTDARPPSHETPQQALGTEVFVVHGRDDGSKQTVARFIEKLGLKPVILHEQPNEGKTVIEKLEARGSSAFAIALLTPDDIGGLAGEPRESLSKRARQNVVFELGFFFGKLGRSRVCALMCGAVERPSDVEGVAYVAFDSQGAWKMKLVQELRSAGFAIDANRII